MEKGILDLTYRINQVDSRTYHMIHEVAQRDNHFYYHGFELFNDVTYSLLEYDGLELDLEIEESVEVIIRLGIVVETLPSPEKERWVETKYLIVKKDENKLYLTKEVFDLPESEVFNYNFIRKIEVIGDQPFRLKSAKLKKGRLVAIECPVLAKSGKQKDTITYEAKLYNCEDREVSVNFVHKAYGWEEMKLSIPDRLVLAPYEVKIIKFSVEMSHRIAEGGYEKQTILVIPEGKSEFKEKITLMTSRYLRTPNVLMSEEEWEGVKKKVATYTWAKKVYDKWLDAATKWEVPKIDEKKKFLFVTDHAHKARGVATMYKLTGDRELGLKVVQFLKELSHSEKGYNRLPRACNQELVHEGEFFKSTAIAYDLVYDMPELNLEDHKNIELTFRHFMKIIDRALKVGNISNWTLAEICGALYCSCTLQDREQIERFLYGIGGATDQLSKGVLDDGWWYEASIGYNLMAAGLFSEIAQVVKHFGINFKDIKVPANYAKSVTSMAVLKDGLVFENWGENTKNYRDIPMLWDSLVSFYNYRGIIFGVNDSSEMKVEGISQVHFDPRYDMAYYLYGKKEYAYLMRNVAPEERDLLFGVGEIPEANEEDKWHLKSAYADNAGVAVLRSRKKRISDRERLQVGLKYGSHGGAHGHYDRVSMTSLMRYGKSIIGPENIWYSYHTFMYKFYVQNSVAHNMVTVDLKQQDPKEPKRLLFYTGDKMQVCALENKSKWCNPPYGGWQVGKDKTLEVRSWNEGRYIPIPKVYPEYTVRTDYTEDILTRRLTVVADDYIVNFDYALGEKVHDYDCLYHLQGLLTVNTEKFKWIGHKEKLDVSPLSSGQFITDCNSYTYGEGACLNFETEFTEEESQKAKWITKNRTGFNEVGRVKTNLHVVYPVQGEVVIGCDPENDTINKQLKYEVRADSVPLAKGQFGAWILGKEKIDINVEEKEILELQVHIREVEFEDGIIFPTKPTIFWGNPYLELEDSKILYLSELPLEYINTNLGKGIGVDYEGGDVKIQAQLFDKAIPAEPLNKEENGVIRVKLQGLGAKRFVAHIGGDYPVGKDEKKRRTVAIHQNEKEAYFTTALEVYEDQPVINQIITEAKNKVRVLFKDGREEEIEVLNLDGDGTDLSVILREYREGSWIVEETRR